jgi:hypothetical protein
VDRLRGGGGTVPLVLAWQSDAGLVIAYAAAMVGFDRALGRVGFTGLVAEDPFHDAGVSRFFTASTLGLGVGFRRVHVLAELGIERDWLTATVDQGVPDPRLGAFPSSTDVRLWSLMPAFALSVRF